jgi:hypothetical protein
MTNVPKQVIRDDDYGRILTIVKGPKTRVDQVLQEMYEKFPTDIYGTAVESREVDGRGRHTLTIVYFDNAYDENLQSMPPDYSK